MVTVALVLASVALALAGIATGLAIVVMRQSAHTTQVLRRHRIAHDRAEGYPDPEPEQAPPVEPRGGHRYAPPTGTMPALTPEQVAGDATAPHPVARPVPQERP
jgi:hypothetical protein